MAGIYIHIPFCLQACHYCDFHFSTSLKHKPALVRAITQEINLRRKEFEHDFTSLYFGGGTPSLLNETDLREIYKALESYIDFAKLKEITIEVNPEDISKDKLRMYKDFGINRLSVGIQSLSSEVLRWMNRVHSYKQAIETLELSAALGFNNLSVDFIYGTPKQLNRDYKQELQELVSYSPKHISCYHLTIEQGTYFGHLKSKNKITDLSDEYSEKEFLWIVSFLKEHNLKQYELSNFSQSGYTSFHNSNYWQQKPYIGIGPSAHSFNNNIRRWNISNNPNYIKKVETKEIFFEEEELKECDVYNERIMLGLRTEKGVDLDNMKTFLNEKQQNIIFQKIKSFSNDGLLDYTKNRIKMKPNKWLLAEYVSRELFILNS